MPNTDFDGVKLVSRSALRTRTYVDIHLHRKVYNVQFHGCATRDPKLGAGWWTGKFFWITHSGIALGTLRSSRSNGAFGAHRTYWTGNTLWSRHTHGAFGTHRTDLSPSPLWTRITCGSGFSCRTLGPNRPWFTLRPGRSSFSGGASGTGRTFFASRPLCSRFPNATGHCQRNDHQE